MLKILDAVLFTIKGLTIAPVATGATVVVGFTIALFRLANDLWGVLLVKIAALTLPTPIASAVITGFGFADHVFPVSEAFSFLTAYLGLVAACALIRMIKSFIPTIA